MQLSRIFQAGIACLALSGAAGCSTSSVLETAAFTPTPAEKPEAAVEVASADIEAGPMDSLIARYSSEYDVPESLVHRVVKRESTYNPQARNGGHYGLMQIKPETARTMGYSGGATGLYDAETNLRYGVKYLRGAWMLADGSEDRAVQLYSSGYYYEAKRRGMLEATGLR